MQGFLIGDVVSSIINEILAGVARYFPQFIAGLLILLIGVISAGIVKRLILEFFRIVKIDRWLAQIKIAKEKDIKVWPEIFAELMRWTIIILFLIPTAETWGVPRVTSVLNELLLYLPNVFVAVLVSMIGVVIANLTFDIVRHSVRGLGSKQSQTIANAARYAIIFFTILVVLNQLGVAAELIRILFTGIVAMFAIAGGLAFGLGGQDLAKDILKEFKKKITE